MMRATKDSESREEDVVVMAYGGGMVSTTEGLWSGGALRGGAATEYKRSASPSPPVRQYPCHRGGSAGGRGYEALECSGKDTGMGGWGQKMRKVCY